MQNRNEIRICVQQLKRKDYKCSKTDLQKYTDKSEQSFSYFIIYLLIKKNRSLQTLCLIETNLKIQAINVSSSPY